MYVLSVFVIAVIRFKLKTRGRVYPQARKPYVRFAPFWQVWFLVFFCIVKKYFLENPPFFPGVILPSPTFPERCSFKQPF